MEKLDFLVFVFLPHDVLECSSEGDVKLGASRCNAVTCWRGCRVISGEQWLCLISSRKKKGGAVAGFHHQEMSQIQTRNGRRKSSDELFDGFRGRDRVTPRCLIIITIGKLQKIIPHLWTAVFCRKLVFSLLRLKINELGPPKGFQKQT